MSHIWMFSPSSEPLLRQCLTAASLQETENKWTQKFGRQTAKPLEKRVESEAKNTPKVIEVAPSPKEVEKLEESVSYEDFLESIEHEIRADIIAKECARNPDLLLKMAQRLTSNTVEKLFKQIFTGKDTETNVTVNLVHIFLPMYIKHQYSWLCVDILTKTSSIYPELFKTLLRMLLEDIEIPNEVLNSYVTTLNEENCTQFMLDLTYINLSSECFVHNILTIYTAYKNCTKNDRIQEYIKANLLRHSQSCSSDRNYGRLFLTYLQTEKTLEHMVKSTQLEECLEIHRSPFKRPCDMILKEFIEN